MSNRQITTCDAPGCGKDITEGQGRMWHLGLHGVGSKLAPGSVPRHDAGTVPTPRHFCDEACLASWATTAAATKAAAQEQFEADNKAKPA